MKKILSAIGLLVISVVCYAATMTSLTKQQMMQTVSDHTLTTVSLVTLDNNLVNNNSVMVYFDKQGKVMGQMSMKPDNGPQNDTGTYMVKTNGALCVTWQNWNKHNPICVFGYKTANSLILINENTGKFETMILNENIQSGNQLSTTMPATNDMNAPSSMPDTTTNGGTTNDGSTNGDSTNGSMNGMQTNGADSSY